MAGSGQRRLTAALGLQGLMQLLAALAAAAGAVILIGEAPSFRVLIVIAALTGATGALLTPYPVKTRSANPKVDFAFPLFYALIGLGAGGGGF